MVETVRHFRSRANPSTPLTFLGVALTRRASKSNNAPIFSDDRGGESSAIGLHDVDQALSPALKA